MELPQAKLELLRKLVLEAVQIVDELQPGDPKPVRRAVVVRINKKLEEVRQVARLILETG